MREKVQVAVAGDVAEAEEMQAILRAAGIEAELETGPDDANERNRRRAHRVRKRSRDQRCASVRTERRSSSSTSSRNAATTSLVHLATFRWTPG